jgi:hypothetical protein
MAFSYDPTLATEKDQVRFLIHDTVSPGKYQDSEIEWVLTQEANVYMAAAQLCEQLVAFAGSVKKKTIGDLSIQYDVAFYRSLAGQLRARGYSHQVPYAGGISVSDKLQQQENADATAPSVFRNLDDNPAAPSVAVAPAQPLEQV